MGDESGDQKSGRDALLGIMSVGAEGEFGINCGAVEVTRAGASADVKNAAKAA
jgi:hypothetical protein